MAKDKTPAPAASKRAPSVIDGVTLTRIRQDGISPPCALYKGEAPAHGDRIKIKLANGVVYAGTVADVTEADGEVLVEFKDGIQPTK